MEMNFPFDSAKLGPFLLICKNLPVGEGLTLK